MRVGVVGLGRMGRPIARRLVEAGHEVRVHDADAARRGGFASASPTRLAAWADALLTVLPGTPELLEVAAELGEPAGVWVDLTSADPHRIGPLMAGPRFAGAPMSGGPADAEAGTLRFLAGGRPELLDTARAVLAPLGEIVTVGPDAASGYTVKLLANLLWFGQSVAAAEALLIGQAAGIDPGTLRALLAQ